MSIVKWENFIRIKRENSLECLISKALLEAMVLLLVKLSYFDIGLISIIYVLILVLAWEPSFAKVTERLGSQASIDILVLLRRSITPAVYRETNFSRLKSTHSV